MSYIENKINVMEIILGLMYKPIKIISGIRKGIKNNIYRIQNPEKISSINYIMQLQIKL